jgi:hypothetical protein
MSFSGIAIHFKFQPVLGTTSEPGKIGAAKGFI